MVSLMDRRISPVCIILRNWFSVVAWWNKAIFSLTKKVSGTQICLMYSAPTTSFSRSTCLSKASLKTQIFSTLYFSLARVLPGICPELPEVHVEGEVHELLREVADAEDVEGDPDGDWLASVVGADSSVVTNLEKGEIDKMIDFDCRPGMS